MIGKCVAIVLGAGLAATASLFAATVVVQGEDFDCDGKSWSVQSQGTQYAPDSGVKHLWGAEGGEGVATAEVTLPEAERYIVWVRHTVMAGGAPTNRGPFRLRVRQGDTVAAEGRFDEAPPAQAPPYIHRYDWSKFTADLTAGRTGLELSKLEPLACSGYTRYVDCVVLTTDDAYEPEVVDFQPKVWLRVTLGPTATPPIYIHCFADHFRAPWYGHFALSKDGYEEGVLPARREAAYLTAGEATPWCDITPAVHEDTGVRLELRGAEKYSYTEWRPELDATFEFATAPEEGAIVKRIARQGAGAGLVIIVPGVLTAETADQLRADAEYCAENVALAGTLPAVTFGRRPERFPFFLSMGMRPELFAPSLREAEYQIVGQLGFNGTSDLLDDMTSAAGMRHTRTGPGAWFMDNDCYLQPQTERIKERVAAAGAEWGDHAPPTMVMFMDEPGGRSLAHAVTCERCGEVFREWLRDELRVSLTKLGRVSWAEVRPVDAEERETSPALYYYSQRFRVKAFADFLRLQTDEITRSYPGAPPATVNFSDGAVYQANMYLMGADYFDIFRSQALTMAWSEDWSNIASTYQCAGYNVELLRAACKYHDQPLGMYVITSYGRTPLDVKLKAYSSLGRGASVLESFAYGPTYAGHEPNWYLQETMYPAMAELTREIGGAEDLLLEAKRVPSQVAFLYSTTSDIWTEGVTDLYGHDRMHSYLALTHAQVPVDFLSEEDVVEGRLKAYRALYVFGPNLLGAAARPIAEWVEAGGVLYLAGGAAVADEYNRPARPLDDAMGLRRGEPRTAQTHLGPGRYLLGLKSQGQVELVGAAGEPMDVLGPWQPLTMSGSRRAAIQGYDAEGQAMAARVTAGRGTVFVSGFAPGLSYIHSALAHRDAQGSPAPDPDDPGDFAARGSYSNLAPQDRSYNPWEYPAGPREYLLLPAREAGVVKPVTLDQRVVESFYLEGPRGGVVTLANYTLQPLANLEVAIRCGRPASRVESVRHGPLPFRMEGGAVTTRLPLGDTDMLKLYW